MRATGPTAGDPAAFRPGQATARPAEPFRCRGYEGEWVSAYRKNRLADVVIYVFAGAGVVYLAQMVLVHTHL